MNQTHIDPSALKQREHQSWTQVAPGWVKHDANLVLSNAPITERMLTVAAVGVGQRLLDIACGSGEPAISAAEQVGPTGSVLATDFVEEMLVLARDKAVRRRLENVEFRRADGETLDVRVGSFDAVLCRLGIMFMPDPLACLRGAHAALRPGGRIAVACWAEPERNPWATVPLGVIKRHVDVPAPPPNAPGLFAFADPARLKQTLETAGFCGVGIDEVHVAFGHVPSGAAYFTFIRELAGPLARLYATLPPEKQHAVDEEVARAAERYLGSSGVALPGVAWVARGTK